MQADHPEQSASSSLDDTLLHSVVGEKGASEGSQSRSWSCPWWAARPASPAASSSLCMQIPISWPETGTLCCKDATQGCLCRLVEQELEPFMQGIMRRRFEKIWFRPFTRQYHIISYSWE